MPGPSERWTSHCSSVVTRASVWIVWRWGHPKTKPVSSVGTRVGRAGQGCLVSYGCFSPKRPFSFSKEKHCVFCFSFISKTTCPAYLPRDSPWFSSPRCRPSLGRSVLEWMVGAPSAGAVMDEVMPNHPTFFHTILAIFRPWEPNPHAKPWFLGVKIPPFLGGWCKPSFFHGLLGNPMGSREYSGHTTSGSFVFIVFGKLGGSLKSKHLFLKIFGIGSFESGGPKPVVWKLSWRNY